jgi:membrane-associated phospholipid phosphatase
VIAYAIGLVVSAINVAGKGTMDIHRFKQQTDLVDQGFFAGFEQIKALILTVLLVAVSCCYLDRELSLLFAKITWNNKSLARSISVIPDSLFFIAVSTGSLSMIIHLYRVAKAKLDATTSFFLLLATAVPFSYVAKTWFKFVFGRVDPQQWLLAPQLYGFHWFVGLNFQAFPSGHMTVFATLAAVVWRYYPRYLVGCRLLLLLLAAALLVTNVHFLSDIIAGAYLGWLVEMAAFHAIEFAFLRPYPLAASGRKAATLAGWKHHVEKS